MSEIDSTNEIKAVEKRADQLPTPIVSWYQDRDQWNDITEIRMKGINGSEERLIIIRIGIRQDHWEQDNRFGQWKIIKTDTN